MTFEFYNKITIAVIITVLGILFVVAKFVINTNSTEEKVAEIRVVHKEDVTKIEVEARDQERRLDKTEEFIAVQSIYNERILKVLEK